jgi:hypothetical protein
MLLVLMDACRLQMRRDGRRIISRVCTKREIFLTIGVSWGLEMRVKVVRWA